MESQLRTHSTDQTTEGIIMTMIVFSKVGHVKRQHGIGHIGYSMEPIYNFFLNAMLPTDRAIYQ